MNGINTNMIFLDAQCRAADFIEDSDPSLLALYAAVVASSTMPSMEEILTIDPHEGFITPIAARVPINTASKLTSSFSV